MKIVKTFAERLKEALMIRDIKPARLSEITGINKSTISQYLSNVYSPKRKRIEIFAKTLNVNEAWLMGYDVSIERNQEDEKSNNKLSLRERLQFEELLQQNAMFFNDEGVSLDDKKKFLDALQEVFYEVKTLKKIEKNNKK